jgi:hypothetical protein
MSRNEWLVDKFLTERDKPSALLDPDSCDKAAATMIPPSERRKSLP